MSDYAKIIAVDFDGTLVTDKWPDVGESIKPVIDYVKLQQQHGAKIILWTNRQGKPLIDAIHWCIEHGINLDAVNEDIPETIERFGSSSRKIYADEFIDDRSLLFKEINRIYLLKDSNCLQKEALNLDAGFLNFQEAFLKFMENFWREKSI